MKQRDSPRPRATMRGTPGRGWSRRSSPTSVVASRPGRARRNDSERRVRDAASVHDGRVVEQLRAARVQSSSSGTPAANDRRRTRPGRGTAAPPSGCRRTRRPAAARAASASSSLLAAPRRSPLANHRTRHRAIALESGSRTLSPSSPPTIADARSRGSALLRPELTISPQRPVGDPLAIGEAAPHDYPCLRCGPGEELPRQPRLPDARPCRPASPAAASARSTARASTALSPS